MKIESAAKLLLACCLLYGSIATDSSDTQSYQESESDPLGQQIATRSALRHAPGRKTRAVPPPSPDNHDSPLPNLIRPNDTESSENDPASNPFKRTKRQKDYRNYAQWTWNYVDLSCGIKVRMPKRTYEPFTKDFAPDAQASKWWDSVTRLPGIVDLHVLRQLDHQKSAQYRFDTIYPSEFLGFFVTWLTARPEGAVLSCEQLRPIFAFKLDPRSHSPITATAGQYLASSTSCYVGAYCPDLGRNREYTILNRDILKAKNAIMLSGGSTLSFAGVRTDHPPKARFYRYRGKLRAGMIDFAMAFEYLNNPHVYNVFSDVNERIRATLRQFDNIPATRLPPLSPGTQSGKPTTHFTSWVDAYDTWLAQYLKGVDYQAQIWFNFVIRYYYQTVEYLGAHADPQAKALELKWLTFHRDENQQGMFRRSNLKLAQGYEHLLRRPLGEKSSFFGW